MFGVTAFIAVAFAAISARNTEWSTVVVSLTAITYAGMAIVAVGSAGAKRAFAIGFFIFGCGYLLLDNLLPNLHQYLVTERVLGVLCLWNGSPEFIKQSHSYDTSIYIRWGHIPDDNSTGLLVEAHHLFLIGNCIWSWLIGYVGGLCCGFAYSRRQKLLSK